TYKIPKHSRDLLVIPYNMITELDTDEELSQTSNLTQDDDLTFDLTSGTTSNDNTQTQPSPAKAIRSSSKSTSVPLTTDQQHSKKRPKLQALNTESTPNSETPNDAATLLTSIITISDTPNTNRLTYSQITQKQLNIPQFSQIDDSEWADILHTKIVDKINTPFDQQTWSYEAIAEALQTPTGIHDFIDYKLITMPTEFTIPPAIFLKFKYLDTRFFTTFTKNPNTTPAHQKEYTNLYNNALAIYKQTNQITFTDAAT
ncbi:1901_t:CDS:2, partial [Paraglomus occultum]